MSRLLFDLSAHVDKAVLFLVIEDKIFNMVDAMLYCHGQCLVKMLFNEEPGVAVAVRDHWSIHLLCCPILGLNGLF